MSIKSKSLFDKIWRNKPYFEDFITRSIYHSNAIEGNTLSYADTYAIVFNDNSVKISAQPRELYEAINLKYAFHHVLQNIESDLSVNLIKELGILVNKNISDIDGFRKTQVFIRGAEHIPPSPADVPRLMSELIYSDGMEKNEDIFYRIARFHIEFERIHPFVDGNGRTGRLLITKELLARDFAPVVIPLDFRSQYLELLATKNILGLAQLLKKLNDLELERMDRFGIKL